MSKAILIPVSIYVRAVRHMQVYQKYLPWLPADTTCAHQEQLNPITAGSPPSVPRERPLHPSPSSRLFQRQWYHRGPRPFSPSCRPSGAEGSARFAQLCHVVSGRCSTADPWSSRTDFPQFRASLLTGPGSPAR